MRLRGRRRPAGSERVPAEVLTPEVLEHPVGPAVLRLGPCRALLDHPGARRFDSVANVWLTNDGWAEVLWPRHPAFGWFVAPIDLRCGHVLEFRREHRALVTVVVESGETWLAVQAVADRAEGREVAGNAVAARQIAWVRRSFFQI